MGKYSGAYIPNADDDGSNDEPSSSPRYAGAYDWQKARAEEKRRLAAWMNGVEPRGWWETYENWQGKYGETTQRFFCMEFPTTSHYFVVAWERAPEFGRLYTWCLGCKHDACGACKWIRATYLLEVKGKRLIGHADENDLPF